MNLKLCAISQSSGLIYHGNTFDRAWNSYVECTKFSQQQQIVELSCV